MILFTLNFPKKKGRLNFSFLLGLAVFFGIWIWGAYVVGSALILPGPFSVFTQFIILLKSESFYRALCSSTFRLLTGLAISVPIGALAGLLAGLKPVARAFLQPFFTTIASTPVMAVILIAYLAFGSERTPIFTAFLMVFPVMASNTIEGMKSIDPKMKEVFDIYRISFIERLRRLYIPALIPFMAGGLRSSISLGWKVVVAAEVLVQPVFSLGAGMQNAKANLETPELFAWTLSVITAAAISDAALNMCAKIYSLKRKYTGKRRCE
ncbi:MAG: ABC transporter permease subunit [Spirochaetaceae bacterium]|jgi:NitT/TauT family transport system permease protein|nr:ABC transporter permease subunit [Spirochaetaceae bacterium]